MAITPPLPPGSLAPPLLSVVGPSPDAPPASPPLPAPPADGHVFRHWSLQLTRPSRQPSLSSWTLSVSEQPTASKDDSQLSVRARPRPRDEAMLANGIYRA